MAPADSPPPGGGSSVPLNFATGGAEAGLPGEGAAALVLSTRADVECTADIGIAARSETLSDLPDVGALIGSDFGFKTQTAPAIPVVTRDLAKTVVGGG